MGMRASVYREQLNSALHVEEEWGATRDIELKLSALAYVGENGYVIYG